MSAPVADGTVLTTRTERPRCPPRANHALQATLCSPMLTVAFSAESGNGEALPLAIDSSTLAASTIRFDTLRGGLRARMEIFRQPGLIIAGNVCLLWFDFEGC